MAMMRGFRSKSPLAGVGGEIDRAGKGASVGKMSSGSLSSGRVALSGVGKAGMQRAIAGAKGGRAHAGHPRGLINKAGR